VLGARVKFAVVTCELLDADTTVRIRGPGAIRHVAFGVREKPVAVVRDILGRTKPETHEEVLIMFVEVDPEQPHVERRFVMVTAGHLVEPREGDTFAHVGTAPSRSGRVVHVYEVVRERDAASVNGSAVLA
jgi:hypothetical protein